MQKRSGSALVAAALFFSGAAIVVPRRAHALSGQESGFLSRLNGERASRGIDPLPVTADLVALARAHSDRMAEDGVIYHNNGLADDVDGDWSALGENVGKGPSVESIHEAFMDSAPHRAHILDPDFNQVGVGTAVDGDVIYVTEIFVAREPTDSAQPKPATPGPRRAERHPALSPPRSVTVTTLLLLAGMDADVVDPRTGAARSAVAPAAGKPPANVPR